MSEATFYTISDRRFFLGLVALVNSLRLAGHREEVVVLDRGLLPAQRDLLAGHARVVALPDSVAPNGPTIFKAYPFLFEPSGVAVLIDSDMIVTASLAPVIARAREGFICVFPDHLSDQERWFPEWESLFALASAPRRQTYANAGLVALSVGRWNGFLERWWELCLRLPAKPVRPAEAQLDQDVLNALLMSEVEPGSIAILPYEAEAYTDAESVVIVDERALTCAVGGVPVSLLHHCLSPKVWELAGRPRLRTRDPYVRILPRVLLGEDVPLRLSPAEVPWWLRPTPASRLRFGALTRAGRAKRRLRALARPRR
jgi:hypothetical protein